MFYSSSYVYNQAGIRYDDTEWINGAYKDQVYYTESGQIFYIQNDMLIPVNGVGPSYSLNCSYINNEGYLIFDTNQSFIQLNLSSKQMLMRYGNPAGVYFSEKYGHVYELRSCAWNVWGNLITPEGSGIKIGNLYLVPFSLSEEYRNLKDQILSWIGYWSMIALVFLSALRIIYLLVKETKKEIKVGCKDYSACMTLFISIAAYVIVVEVADIVNSFTSFFISAIIYSYIVWNVMTFVQGRVQMEYFMREEIKEVYPGGVTLRDMKEYAVLSEVSLWRKRYIKLVSIYSIWWFVLCVIYSI